MNEARKKKKKEEVKVKESESPTWYAPSIYKLLIRVANLFYRNCTPVSVEASIPWWSATESNNILSCGSFFPPKKNLHMSINASTIRTGHRMPRWSLSGPLALCKFVFFFFLQLYLRYLHYIAERFPLYLRIKFMPILFIKNFVDFYCFY